MLRYQDLLREVSKFANVLKVLGVQQRGRRRGLHAAGSGTGDRAAGLRRIGAPHTVIFGGFSAESLSGRIKDCKAKVLVTADARLSAGQAGPAQGKRRRRGGGLPAAQGRDRLPPDRHAGQLDARPRPLVARARGERIGRLPGRAARQRASALHPLHVGIDRQTEGHLAHDRRLSAGHDAHQQVGLRPQGRRHILVHGRRRLGHRALVPGLRPALATGPPA